MKITEISKNDAQLIWPVSFFYQAYQDRRNLILKSSLLSLSRGSTDPDKIAQIIVRVGIEKGKKISEDQKYLIGLRFYSFGEIATLDLLSLDYPYHQDIACQHLQNFNWPINGEGDKFTETISSLFMFSGGNLNFKEKEGLNFFEINGDCENHFITVKNNDLAAFLISTVQNSKFNGGNIVAGKSFVQDILEIILKNKLQNNFYEKLLEISKELSAKFTTQQLWALLAMKAYDRISRENKNFLSIMAEELSTGLGRDMLLISKLKGFCSPEKKIKVTI